jgi:hypothetical protein
VLRAVASTAQIYNFRSLIGRQVIVVIEHNVSFDAALRLTELGPRKHLQTKTDGGGIQRQQFVFETELLLAQPQPLLIAEARQRRIEQVLIQLGGAMFIGVREGGFIRRHADSEMHQLAEAAGESVADLAQRVRMSQLAKQHRDQLRSATEAFGRPFCFMFFHQSRELEARKILQQLIKRL